MKRYLVCIFIFLFSCISLSSHFELDFYGVSYHLIGKGYQYAPRKIDDGAAWIFNPGLGLTYDFRKNVYDEGFSPLLIAGYFHDCDDRAFVFGGAGGRYRHEFFDSFLFDINFAIIYASGQDWATGDYNGYFMPILNVGVGTSFLNRLWSYRIAYIPENTGITATSGGDLLFMNISIQL